MDTTSTPHLEPLSTHSESNESMRMTVFRTVAWPLSLIWRSASAFFWLSQRTVEIPAGARKPEITKTTSHHVLPWHQLPLVPYTHWDITFPTLDKLAASRPKGCTLISSCSSCMSRWLAPLTLKICPEMSRSKQKGGAGVTNKWKVIKRLLPQEPAPVLVSLPASWWKELNYLGW